MTAGAVLLVTGPWPSGPWADAIRRAAPQRPLQVWPSVTDAAAIRYALAWKPQEGILNGFPNLEAIFSLGAGVDHIILQERLPDVPIVRVVSADLTQRMTEWVTLQVLMHHRRQRIYDARQAERTWQELPQPAAEAVRVGVMGLGVLGRDAAEVLKRLGFRVAGWSRRPATLDGIETFHGADGLTAFLRRTDILVCLLPLTPETKGILSMALFRQLPHDGALGPVVINGGRGGLQVEDDIVAAIRDGVLAGASIDVFATEPLDTASDLWMLPNVVITPHVAAASTPDAIAPEIMAEIESYERGSPLRNVVDRATYY
jgi:glyoxylate/hydroxypyruvate reductase A